LANETVGDLSTKTHAVIGCAKHGRIIFKGVCHEYLS